MSKGPVRTELDRALKNAQRQKMIYARHAGTVAAARALADKIDAWDVIVQFALEDAPDGVRPAVPDHDNASLPTFLKYMDQLGLTVAADRAEAKARAMRDRDRGRSPVVTSVSPVERMKRERAARQKKTG